jgi:hypothetical protein
VRELKFLLPLGIQAVEESRQVRKRLVEGHRDYGFSAWDMPGKQ